MVFGSADDVEALSSTILRVDLNAVEANYRLVQATVGGAGVGAVVKANAYGLGGAEVSQALVRAGCRHFFVAELGEALDLKPRLPPTAAVYVLNGLHPGAETVAARGDVIPVLNSLDQIARWGRTAAQSLRRLPAALQLDTGMARLGLTPEEGSVLDRRSRRLEAIDVRLIMSHLACADEPGSRTHASQAAAFLKFASKFPGVPRSLDNSAGAFLAHDHFDIVRAGIALYGGAPHLGMAPPPRPVVQLLGRLIQLRDLPPGAGVGYGLTGAAPVARRVATVGAGYADGWLPALADRGSAFITGRRVPIIGRISMDSLILDVTALSAEHLRPGALVELLGLHQTINDVARDAGAIPYQVLVGLGRRSLREYGPLHMLAGSPVK